MPAPQQEHFVDVLVLSFIDYGIDSVGANVGVRVLVKTRVLRGAADCSQVAELPAVVEVEFVDVPARPPLYTIELIPSERT